MRENTFLSFRMTVNLKKFNSCREFEEFNKSVRLILLITQFIPKGEPERERCNGQRGNAVILMALYHVDDILFVDIEGIGLFKAYLIGREY